MFVIVPPELNTMPDRELIVRAALRSAKFDPVSPGIFKWNDVIYFQAMTQERVLCIGIYGNGNTVFVPYNPT